MNPFKAMMLSAAMFIAGIVGMILMVKYTATLAEYGALGSSMMLTGALTIFGAIIFHHERDVWRSQRKHAPFFKSLKEYRYTLGLEGALHLLLIIVTPFAIMPLLILLVSDILTDFSGSFELYVVTLSICVIPLVYMLRLRNPKLQKQIISDIWNICRGKENAAG